MAAEPWNRVNLPFPSAVSSVRIHCSRRTGVSVKSLLAENEKVLTLLRSEILQTEIRVLYELLYVLNNSYRGNKTFRALKQVEQCINRLKDTKLDVALQDLKELCPNRIQRALSIKDGECDVPSQPMLEWLCLKVLGAAQLMSCTMIRCSRAFILSRQQMKWEEFVILNIVLTSLLSRLWVIFRGVLTSLSTLYQQLLLFLREVAGAQPMPFLTDFSLPGDLAQVLGPSDASLLAKHATRASNLKATQQKRKKSFVKVMNQGRPRTAKDDLGVAVERDLVNNADMKPFLKVVRNITKGKSLPRDSHNAERERRLKKQVSEAATFADTMTHVEAMIQWCKSQKMEKEKRLLMFLHLKGQRMKNLEAAGHNVKKKLQSFRQDACWAFSPRGSNTSRPSAAMRKNALMKTRKRKLKLQSLHNNRKNKRVKRRRRTESSVSGRSEDVQRSRTTPQARVQTGDCNSHDDIDDIFASIGI